MSMDFQPGSRIGKYTLDSYVGSGSFGAVWRGHAEGDTTPVAVKLLTGTLGAGETSPVRADVEVLAAAAARRSEHVVRVLDGGVEPVPYIVMEFVQGGDIQSLLRDQGHLSIQQTIDVGLAVADALRALFYAGIIHRDIKPANVMIDEAGVIKLADFGIAKIVGYATVSVSGQTAMTMAYAAPEIWDEDSEFGRPSHRSDLYALGVLLYQCLSGVTPFTGNYNSLYRAHLERPPDMTVLPPETPASLRILIGRCLAKRQQERPKDAAECLGLLERAAVEAAEAAGEVLNEPRRLGPWVKEQPHESVPWAWRCHNERTGDKATVEVYFSDDLEFGEKLADMVAANARLAPLGAERLLGSSRLLLFPNESWRAAPPGEFQFWLAREDRDVAAAETVTHAILRTAVQGLAGLIAAAKQNKVSLDLRRDHLTMTASGDVYVRRPGLGAAETEPEAGAFAWLLSLPLDDHARRVVNSVPDFAALVQHFGEPPEQATVVAERTQIVTQPPERATVVVERRPPVEQQTVVMPAEQPAVAPAPAMPQPVPAVPLRAELNPLRTGTRFGPAAYQLVLENRTQVELHLRFGVESADASVSLPPSASLRPGATQALAVSVRPHRRRLWGGPVQRSFSIAVSGDGMGPPQTFRTTFRDDSYMPIIAAGGGLGLLIVVALVAILAAGGGGGENAAAAATRASTFLAAYQFSEALGEYNTAIERDADNAAYYAGRARAQLNLGDLASAASDADKGIELDAANAEAHYVRSMIYDWQERRDEAIFAATKAIELSPQTSVYYANRSRIYGDRDSAKQKTDADKAIELGPDDAEAHMALGFAYRVQKRYPEAEAEYAKAVTLDPKNGLRYARQAGFYFNRDDYERALRILDENKDVIAFYPLSKAEGHWVRGATYIHQQKFQDALGELNKSLELVPLAPSFLDWRGYNHYLLEDYKAATADLNKAIELSPNFEDPYYVRSLVAREQGQTDTALQDINKAIALDPADATYQTSLAALYWRLNNYASTVTAANKAIELDPADGEAYNLRSLARAEQGQTADALADATKAIELKPGSALYYGNRAAVYMDLKNYQAAIDDLNKAIGIDGNNASFYNRRGVAYSWLDNDQAAIADYSRAIQINPNVFRYYMNRGIAEENLNRIADARADYEKARSLAANAAETQEAQQQIDSLPR